MDDRELRDLLLEIPRDAAPPGFSSRVMAQLDAVDARVRARRRARPLLALAATVALALGSTALYNWRQRVLDHRASAEQARLAHLETEYRSIEQELGELQRLVAAAQPVVGVEGPGERGYLLDVGELARARAEGSVPVAYRLSH